MTDGNRSYTALGLLAVVLWSTSIGVSRSLIERVGTMTAAASLLLVSGVIGCAWLAFTDGGLRRVLKLPVRYLVGCGLLLVFYDVCLYLALGLAADRAQVLVVGVINYLWPGLTLAFSVPILRRRAGRMLVPGLVVAFGGTALALAGGGDVTWASFADTLRSNPAPYAIALVAAVTWALYSNLARKWGGDADGGAVPLFLLAAGVVTLALRFVLREQSHWTWPAAGEVLFMALLPSLLAYTFWDLAVRRGDHTLVASFSYVTPLLSTAISCLYLHIVPGWNLWVACVLVAGGAVVCRRSLRAEVTPPPCPPSTS